MGKFIRVTEAACRLGVHRQTLENWAAKGIINIKKMKNAHYVDEELIEQIGDLGTDVEKSRMELEKLKEEYSNEIHNIERMRNGIWVERQYLNDERRYLNLCVLGGIRSQFFQSVIFLMECYGSLTSREGEILRKRLEGESLEEIANQYGLIRERVRQIVEKAIRKSKDLYEIKEKFDTIQKYEADIAGLKVTIKDLREKLKIQDEIERVAEEKSLEEKRKMLIEKDKLCKLFSKKLVDCDISVRALNCLKSGGMGGYFGRNENGLDSIETVGELCKHTKLDILKLRNMGKKTLMELDDFLKDNDLTWGMDVDNIFKERIDCIMSQDEATL